MYKYNEDEEDEDSLSIEHKFSRSMYFPKNHSWWDASANCKNSMYLNSLRDIWFIHFIKQQL